MLSGSPSAGRSTRLALAVAFSLVGPFGASPAIAQASGGFVEKADSTAIRTVWTAAQIQAFLPARGRFTFPQPYNTQGIRLTNSTDCDGADCLTPLSAASGRNINNHRGSDTMLIFLGLRGAGPTLFSYNKVTDEVVKLGSLFDPSSPLAAQTGEGWYFSATQPTKLYVSDGGAALLRYDVQARALETVFDVTARFGSDKAVSQMHSSDDDNVHSATLSDLASHAVLGCLAYREDSRQFSYYPATGSFDECQVDRSGRWLLIKENVDGAGGEDNRIIDLQTGSETLLLDRDGAAGPSDNGYGYMVAGDQLDGVPRAVRVWGFGGSPLPGTVVYHDAYVGTAGLGHLTHSNAQPGLAPSQQYACGGDATTTVAPRANEIVCFRLDGSLDVLVVTQLMTDPDAAGGGAGAKQPAGNLDVTGGYFIWTGNMGGSRSDAFIVKVPAAQLTGSPDASPTAVLTPGTTDVAAASADATATTDLAATANLPDPLGLPVATTLQVPLTAAYNLLGVPQKAAGASYLDPTTGVKIYKLTSSTFPTTGSSWGHDYSEGGDEVSLPYNGNTRAVLVYSGNWHWLIDFTPGVGVSNVRSLTGNLTPFSDGAFTFSNNPATPYYAYTSNGSSIRRFDMRTMTEAPGSGWPVTETNAVWLHQSENDGLFVWMRGATGSVVVGYEPSTATLKTYTNANINEPRIDRAGRYVGICMNTPQNGLVVWDWQANSINWTTTGVIPYAHNASLRRRWVTVDWNLSFPDEFSMFTPDVANSATHIGGPAPSTDIHGNGNWIQHPADLNDQWALFVHYGSLQPTGSNWLAPGGMILMTPNGQRRLLGHPYNATSNYTYFTFAKFSSDGLYVLFTSDMNGSGRSDLFLAEVPQSGSSDTTPPTVSISAPAAGATVSGGVTVSANASDNVGVVGVQFKLDGNNLGAEDTGAPYSMSWDTTLGANGSHSLTAVARDAAGNSTVSSAVGVTVGNVDTTPPVISSVSSSGISSLSATVAWTTNEPADSQVEYGPTTSYGSSTALDGSRVVSHSQALSGLAAGTLYHYRVKSKDAAGNPSVSTDFTFTTLAGLDTGLIAHLSMDEGTGTTAADSSGSGNPGTLTGGATWTAGTSGQGVALDGASGYVRIAHNSALDAFPLSAVLWFKTATISGVRGLVNKYVAGSANGYQIFFSDASLCAWYFKDASNYVWDGSGCTMSTAGYNDGQWHQAVLVVDAAGGRLFVDGVQKGSQPWTGTAGPATTTQEIELGHYAGATSPEYLPGTIDELRLYSRPLVGAEVLQLYNNSRPVADTTPPVLSSVGVTSIGASSATVVWTTDEAADSQVEYGLTSAYGSATTVDGSLVVAHSQAITGLTAATLYHYRVKSKDGAGNLAVSPDATFLTLDNVPPVISSVSATAVTASGATIVWSTNEAADSQVDYGLTSAYGSSTTLNAGLVTSHSQGLSGLAGATLYHYRVKSKDAAGNLAVSPDGTFLTLDNVAPVISSVSATAITSSSATIVWTTNESADSQVDSGPTSAYGSTTPLNGSMVVSHSQVLSGIAAGTLCHYRVKSKDAAANLAVSGDFTFTTLNGGDPSLIAYLKMDEGSGTTATDSSGNNNAGTLLSGATWTAGTSGQAVALDGVAGYVRIAHNAALDAFPLTAAVWFKTSTTSGVRGLVSKYVPASYNGYQIFFSNGSLCAWYFKDISNYVYDGGSCPMSTAGYNDGRWHQAVFVVDATGGRLYVDGVQKGSRAWTGTAGTPTTSQEIRLGQYSSYLPGTVDELRLYNRALIDADVLQLYNDSRPTGDTTPPVISAVAVGGIGAAGATVSWTTDEPSDSQVDYGLTSAYGSSTTLNAGLVTSHSQDLSGLAGATLYHYRVKSKDAAGNLAVSPDATFLTLDNVAPVISSVSATAITSSSATIVWTTNESADSQVDSGPTSAYGSTTPLNGSMVVSHSQVLSGIAAGTLCHYRVKSKDAAANLAVSGDFTFTTLSGGDPGLIAYLKMDEGSGITAADSSGSGNAGTLMSGATWTAGASGQAVALDGVAGYVRIAHNAALDAFPLTAAVWFKTTTNSGFRGLVNKYVAASLNGYQMFFNNGNLCAWYFKNASNYVYDGGGCTMSSPGYNDGQWHHAVFVVDATGGRLYVDGAQKGSQAWTGAAGAPTTIQDVQLGHYPGAAAAIAYLPGSADELRLYNRGLSATEVLQIYTDSRPAGDTTPPVISAVSAGSIGAAGATVTWTTSEPADTQVEYGPTTAYGSSTTVNGSLVLAHSQAVSGLAAGTLYHYRVKSRDAAGNPAVSADFTFTTASGPDAGLIVHLALDEGTGTTAADSSGSGNTGTLMNGAAWAAGTTGQAVALDGVDDYVRIAHNAGLDAFPLTVAVWFKTTTNSGVRGLASKYAPASYNGYQIFFNNGKLCAWYWKDISNYVYDGGSCTMSTAGTTDGRWHQAALVVDSAGGRLYVDGVQKASQAWTGTAGAPTTTQEIRIGQYSSYLPGTVDELRLYNRALSAAEISQLYGGSAFTEDTTPPVISAVGVSGVGATGATVTWTTDEPADSQVEYGPTSSYGSSTTLDGSLVASHSQALAGLTAATLYHYRVKSTDAAGNPAVSADSTFTTSSLADAGLVVHLALDEGTGTTAADSSGSGNTGTLMNGAAWTAGASGQAVALDGVDDYVSVAHNSALDAFPLTVSVWFKTSTTSGVRGLVSKYLPASYNGYQVFFSNGNLCAWYWKDISNYVYDGGSCTMSTAGYNDGQWHQAVLVVDAAGGVLYVDGAQKGSQAWTGTAGAPTTGQEIQLGHYSSYLPGAIDELRVYSRALGATEVSQLYAAR